MKNSTPWFLVFLLVPLSSMAATFTVTNTNDSGGGSLRQAVTDGNSTAGNDAIQFNLGSAPEATITLQSSLPPITEGVTLDGPAGTIVTIDANRTGSVFVIDSPGDNQTVAMSRLVIKGGNSGGLEGGGIYVGNGDTFNLTDASVESNSAGSGPGGGIFNVGISTLTGVTLTANSAGTDGGGIYNDAGGTVTVINGTISGNTADRDGGGVFYGGGVITLNQVTITGNIASANSPADNEGDGGGIFGAARGSQVNVNNTIIAGNIDRDNGGGGSVTYAPDCWRVISTSYSLLGISNSACFPSFPDINLIGSESNPIDPKLSSLANNGGFTKTHALQSGSPAIDAGSPATQGNTVCASTDQRGFARPKDGDASGSAICDMGAFEIGCGDSIIQSGAGEECDDGNTNNNDACTDSCKNARCGDGIIGPAEPCDDGNTVNTDSCTNSCQPARCGDVIVGPGEGCDDGNAVNTDSCTNACQPARCGDAIVGPSEVCDDGNTANGDGCDSSCKQEAPAGSGSSGGSGSGSTDPVPSGGSGESSGSGSPEPSSGTGEVESGTSETPTANPSGSSEKSGGGCSLLPQR